MIAKPKKTFFLLSLDRSSMLKSLSKLSKGSKNASMDLKKVLKPEEESVASPPSGKVSPGRSESPSGAKDGRGLLKVSLVGKFCFVFLSEMFFAKGSKTFKRSSLVETEVGRKVLCV
jgi:hypothetical protein